MRLGLAAGVVVMAISAPAFADQVQFDPDLLVVVDRPRKLQRSYSQQIADQLTVLGEELDTHLGALSFDRFDIKMDGRARRAHLRLGKGGDGPVAMRIDGDVKFEHGMAKVDAKIDLKLGDRRLQLELPRVDLVPRTWCDGEHYLEVRLPILRGSFEPETWLARR